MLRGCRAIPGHAPKRPSPELAAAADGSSPQHAGWGGPSARLSSSSAGAVPGRGGGIRGAAGDMRFRFCGDLDCPDWVLAEISTLAKISSVKLKLICAQVLRDLLGGSMEYEKILKLTSDAKLESGDVKATIAVLGFILSSAAKHGVDSESLSSELQQLGLPKGRGDPGGVTVNPSLTLSKKLKLMRENPDILELCHTVPMEVIATEKNLYDADHPDNYTAFKSWLQCYLVPGMSSLRDRNGRTIWFQGEPGPMAPKGELEAGKAKAGANALSGC
ncbi:uncharacterized protein AAGF69_007778 [Amazona ochrocephala]